MLLTLLSACATLDAALSRRGTISTDISKFDKSKVVKMTPALANHGAGYPEFGLYWEGKYGDHARLVVQMKRAANFSRSESLEVIIDGDKLVLKPVQPSDFGGLAYNPIIRKNISEKDFIITKKQILKIANGKEGGYRLHLLRTYIDGDINYSYQNYKTYLPKPFKEFYNIVWGNTK